MKTPQIVALSLYCAYFGVMVGAAYRHGIAAVFLAIAHTLIAGSLGVLIGTKRYNP